MVYVCFSVAPRRVWISQVLPTFLPEKGTETLAASYYLRRIGKTRNNQAF